MSTMTIDRVIDELREAADDRGISYEVRDSSFYVGLYEIALSETDDGVRWRIPALVGGRYISDESGDYSSGDARSLVGMVEP